MEFNTVEELKEQITRELREACEKEFVGKPTTPEEIKKASENAGRALYRLYAEYKLVYGIDINMLFADKLED